MAIEMYAGGLSTRDVEDTLRDPETGELILSKDAVSELTEELLKEYERFCERDLSGFNVVYLFVDAVYESLRQMAGMKEAILCCWAITSGGHKSQLECFSVIKRTAKICEMMNWLLYRFGYRDEN